MTLLCPLGCRRWRYFAPHNRTGAPYGIGLFVAQFHTQAHQGIHRTNW